MCQSVNSRQRLAILLVRCDFPSPEKTRTGFREATTSNAPRHFPLIVVSCLIRGYRQPEITIEICPMDPGGLYRVFNFTGCVTHFHLRYNVFIALYNTTNELKSTGIEEYPERILSCEDTTVGSINNYSSSYNVKITVRISTYKKYSS